MDTSDNNDTSIAALAPEPPAQECFVCNNPLVAFGGLPMMTFGCCNTAVHVQCGLRCYRMNNGCPTCRGPYHQDIQAAFQGEGGNQADGLPVHVIFALQNANNNNNQVSDLLARNRELRDANDRLMEANHAAVDDARAEYRAKVIAEEKLHDLQYKYNLLLRDSSNLLQRACHTVCDLQDSLKFACRAVRDSEPLNYEFVFYQHAIRSPRATFWQTNSVAAVKDRFPDIQDWFPTEDTDDVLSVEVTAQEMRDFKIALKADEQLLRTLKSKDEDYDDDAVSAQHDKVALMRKRLAAMVVPDTDSQSAACDA